MPGATIERAETDAEGAAYQAHVTKADGSEATVKLDASFNVTSVEDGQGLAARSAEVLPAGALRPRSCACRRHARRIAPAFPAPSILTLTTLSCVKLRVDVWPLLPIPFP